MNIFEIIEQDHREQRVQMERLVNTEGDSEERRSQFEQFCAEYKAHAAAEEQVFYAALMEHPEGTDKARHSVAEHQQAWKMLEELGDTDMSSAGWLQTMKKVQHENVHHMEEEEDEVFPHARNVMTDEDFEVLGKAFQERKQKELDNS